VVDRNRLITAGSRVRLRLAPDERLVSYVRRGDTVAFEALYERHATELLSFCVYMLGSRQDAEDALQTTFASAYRALLADRRPVVLRAWLFTVARNACLSILRRRRPIVELTGEEMALAEGPAGTVELREDIRSMLEGLRELPEHQRAALVLAEIHGLSQAEIGEVLSVRPDQVKAYIYQARTNLISDREAREADCRSIREELATARGAARLRGRLRRHVRTCAGCRVYADGVASQRRHLGALIPFVPSLALKYRALEDALSAVATAPGTYGGGAAVGAAVELAGGGAKGLLVKVAASVACLGASAGVGVSVLKGEHESPAGGTSGTARTGAPLLATLDGERSPDGSGNGGVSPAVPGPSGTRRGAGTRGLGGGHGSLLPQREGAGQGEPLGRPRSGLEGTSSGGGEARGGGGRERQPKGSASTPAGDEARQHGREERQAKSEAERLQQHDERQRRREAEMPGGGSRSAKAEEERALKREERKPKGASRPPKSQEELALKREKRIRKHEEHKREAKETEEKQ
jgi:RNA polymerase sigma factor (sigma-70 family)